MRGAIEYGGPPAGPGRVSLFLRVWKVWKVWLGLGRRFIEDPPRGEHRRPTFCSRPSRRWFDSERSTFLAFALGEVLLSSVRTAGSRLVLGGSRLVLGGSRQILGFLDRSRPKRQPEWPQDGERGGQMSQGASKINENGDRGDPKRLPEASQNTKKTRFISKPLSDAPWSAS